MNYVYHNGSFELFEKVSLPLTNRNFLYGDGIFESIRCINGIPMFIHYHLERLLYGINVLKLQPDQNLSGEFLSKTISELNKLNNHNEGVRIRLVIGRNIGNTYKPDKHNSSLYITSVAVADNYYSWPQEGLTLGLFSEIKKQINLFSSFKTCNSLLYVMASVYFAENKLDDCVLINEHNFICEGSSSNVFWVKANALYTPPLSDGCINGVLRNILIKHFNAIEKSCTVNELKEADEIFLTNMGGGIRWVSTFQDKMFDATFTRSLFDELNNKIITGVLY